MGLTPLNLHGDRRLAGTDRMTGRRHRADPEREKKGCRDRQMGGSHRTDPHGLRMGAGTKEMGTTMEARGTSRTQQPQGATRGRESHGTHLQLLKGVVHVGDLVLLVHGRLVTEEADDGAVGEAEELHLLVVLAGEGLRWAPRMASRGKAL